MAASEIDSGKPGRYRRSDLRTFRRIGGYFKPHKTRIAFIFALTVLATLLDLVNPLLTRVLFDDAIGKRDLRLLLLVAAAMVVTPTVRALVSVIQTYLNALVGQRVMRDLRNQLYDHLQRMPLRFFASTRTGEIQSRLANDVSGVENVLSDTFVATVRNGSSLVGTVIAMVILSPLLTLISLGLLPVVYIVSTKVGKANRAITAERQESLASLSALMQETLSISGALLIKTFGRQDLMQERFERENQQLADVSLRRQMVGIWSLMFSIWIFSLAPVAVYLVAGWEVIRDPNPSLTVGTIIAFTALQSRLVGGFGPITQLLNTRVEIQGSLALFDRLFDYLDMPVEIENTSDALRLDPKDVRGRLTFRNVTFAYGQDARAVARDLEYEEDGHSTDRQSTMLPMSDLDERGTFVPPQATRPWALADVSFEIEPGQLVALVGPSGAGKSTIISLVPRLYDVDSGAVEIDGIDVRQIALASLSQIVGMVTQETYLFHASIRENFRFARPDASEAKMISAARAAAIHDRIMELDDGYDTVVGERGYKLSGGERQRVAIARVVLKDPRILILDEATSALDTRSERLIQEALATLRRDRTTLAIAHRLSTILTADLILVVDSGRIVERGRHEDLVRDNGLYAALYHEQFARDRPGSGRSGVMQD